MKLTGKREQWIEGRLWGPGIEDDPIGVPGANPKREKPLTFTDYPRQLVELPIRA